MLAIFHFNYGHRFGGYGRFEILFFTFISVISAGITFWKPRLLMRFGMATLFCVVLYALIWLRSYLEQIRVESFETYSSTHHDESGWGLIVSMFYYSVVIPIIFALFLLFPVTRIRGMSINQTG